MGTSSPTPALPTPAEIEAATSFTCSADDGLMDVADRLSGLVSFDEPIEGLSLELLGALWRVTTLCREDLGRAMDYIESIERSAERLLWRFDDQQAA